MTPLQFINKQSESRQFANKFKTEGAGSVTDNEGIILKESSIKEDEEGKHIAYKRYLKYLADNYFVLD